MSAGAIAIAGVGVAVLVVVTQGRRLDQRLDELRSAVEAQGASWRREIDTLRGDVAEVRRDLHALSDRGPHRGCVDRSLAPNPTARLQRRPRAAPRRPPPSDLPLPVRLSAAFGHRYVAVLGLAPRRQHHSECPEGKGHNGLCRNSQPIRSYCLSSSAAPCRVAGRIQQPPLRAPG